MKRFVLAAALLATTAPLQARVVLSDTFDAEAQGQTVQNYNSFANWTTFNTVDLLRQGAFSLNCVGRTGSCVDLDGSGGTLGSGIQSRFTYDFRAGDTVTLAFDLSGSQRGDVNAFTAGFVFDSAVSFDQFTRSGGYGSNAIGGGSGTTLFQTASVNSGDPYATYILSFRALSDGLMRARFTTSSFDSLGPLIDNITLSVDSPAAVPEPASWAMMIAGFGVVGMGLRRRRTAIVAA